MLYYTSDWRYTYIYISGIRLRLCASVTKRYNSVPAKGCDLYRLGR